jgi:hypothetical protein
MRFSLTGILALSLLAGSAAAKPPDVPAPPKVNGEVAPPSVQDFFTPDPTRSEPEPPLPRAERRGLPIVWGWLADMGAAIRSAHAIESRDRPTMLADTPLENLERIRKAAKFYELGEALREAGESKLAASVYEEARALAPGSRYAHLSSERLQTLKREARADASQAESEQK